MVIFILGGLDEMNLEQIYHVWERYLRKLPVERRKISRAERRGKFSLKMKIGIARHLVFCVVFCTSMFVLFVFYFWSLCCLCFFGLWLMLTPLVSSNSSLNYIRMDFMGEDFIRWQNLCPIPFINLTNKIIIN